MVLLHWLSRMKDWEGCGDIVLLSWGIVIDWRIGTRCDSLRWVNYLEVSDWGKVCWITTIDNLSQVNVLSVCLNSIWSINNLNSLSSGGSSIRCSVKESAISSLTIHITKTNVIVIWLLLSLDFLLIVNPRRLSQISWTILLLSRLRIREILRLILCENKR